MVETSGLAFCQMLRAAVPGPRTAADGGEAFPMTGELARGS